ncbi:MAG: PHP domain-containing protein [Treponema sp.]|nr:PHP domain-containing protein [Treponema sp.]
MIDLHTHSSASDGSFSPSGLVAEAEKRGISVLALTDHDSIEGLEEAAKAAMERGIGFIPGIEVEIAWNRENPANAAAKNAEKKSPTGEFHLLGLGISRSNPEIIRAIEELARRREARNLEIVDKMNKAGIAISYPELKALVTGQEAGQAPARRHSFGRLHFADFLVKKKLVKNHEQAFARYLGRGQPFFFPKEGLEFEQAVELIKNSGGISVLAHPMSLYLAWGQLPSFVKNLKERGLDGIEAWHPNAKLSACRRLEELAKNLGLYISAGSDFHGEARPDRKLGITAGGKKIDESLLYSPDGSKSLVSYC